MDQAQSRTLLPVVAGVPDPRHARGKHLAWRLLLGVLAVALRSQQRGVAAIAHWAHEHAASFRTAFQPVRGRLPSASTRRRALQRVDSSALEQALAQFVTTTPQTSAPDATMHGQALDGKYVRGAGVHGAPTLLVSRVSHTTAQVLEQVAMTDKRHESRAVPPLLAGRDLTDTVITMDAGLTQPQLAQQMLKQQGHYLMVVKGNQHQVYAELTWYFDTPPLPCDRPWRHVTTVNTGHGRLETRRLTCTDDVDDDLRWPGVQQVLRRECERIVLTTGQVTRSVTYGRTSLGAADVTAAQLEALWRGHWTIENRLQYVRDVSMGEDAQQVHTS